jgi:hypothetical protein
MSGSGSGSESESQDAADVHITVDDIRECQQFLAAHMPREIALANELKELRKQSKEYKQKIKDYIAQEDLESFEVCDVFSINAPKKPVEVINKSMVLTSKALTGKRRRDFLAECTKMKRVYKNVFSS